MATATVDAIRAAGGIGEAFVADVGSPTQVTRLCDDVATRLEGLDVLVNNAGVVGMTTVEATTDDAWSTLLAINLSGSFYAARAALPHLRRSEAGRILFISSIAGIRISTAGNAAYAATKAGMLGLMRHLAAEAASDGITVNAILPGGVMTPLLAREYPDISEADLFSDVPLGRGGTVQEIGEIAVFLAGSSASYVTGAEIVVDGGRSILPGSVQARHRR